MHSRLTAILILALTAHHASAKNKAGEHWVATWTTAQPLALNLASRPVPAPPQSGSLPAQSAAPASAPITPPQRINAGGFTNQTVRMIVRTSIGGSRMRIRLHNALGSEPVVLGAAHVALSAGLANIDVPSDRLLTFDGRPGCTVGPGAVIVSDPIDFPVPPSGDVAVSLYFPGETGPPTSHTGMRTTFVSKEGNRTGEASIQDPITVRSYFWLAGLDVLAPASASLIVALGDSITEGYGSTPDTNRMWAAILSTRLRGNKKTGNLAVANMGIGGNRMLRNGTGASVLARFDHDVLGQPGVRWVILLEGINDIGRSDIVADESVTVEDLIASYKQVIERAHTFGIKVVGCTLLPFWGAGYADKEGEDIRAGVNTWIRTSGAYDAVVDFDAVTRDPHRENSLRPEFDPGDHLHPNDAGYQAMANAISLSIFGGEAK